MMVTKKVSEIFGYNYSSQQILDFISVLFSGSDRQQFWTYFGVVQWQ
jgi:hypothetical protein